MPIETQRDDGPSAVSVSTKVVVVQALRPIDDDRREVESKLLTTGVDLIFKGDPRPASSASWPVICFTAIYR